MTTDYLCNLVTPGAAKSGTSALHELLALHPEVSMSREKEPHHFSRADRFAQGAEAHNALFKEGKAKVFGESSTSYMPWEPALDRIAQSLASPKAIMVLRDPVERTFSHYRWRVRLGVEQRPFLQAVREGGHTFDPENPSGWGHEGYLLFSNYSRYVPLWIERLGREQVLLLNAAELKDRPRQTLDACFTFLGVGPHAIDTGMAVNETAEVVTRPGRWLSLAAKLAPSGLKGGLYQRLKRGVLKARTPETPQAMTQEERAAIEAALAPDIDYFNTLFGT